MSGTRPRVRLGATWWLAALVAPQVVGIAVRSRLAAADVGEAYPLTLAAVGLLLGVVALRETSRGAVLSSLGTPVRRLVLLPVGSPAETEGRAGPAAEALAAAAALLVTTALAAGAALALRLHGSHGPLGVVLLELTAAATGVAAVQLLPGAPLDGGTLLAAGLRARGRAAVAADRAAARSGQALAVVAGLVALADVVAEPSAPALGRLVVVGLVAASVHAQASRRALAAGLATRAGELAAGDLARAALPAPASAPLAVALARAEAEAAGGIVVVDGDGRPTGVVDERAAAGVPLARRPWTAVADVARPVRGLVLPAALTGDALLRALRAHPAPEYLVVDADGATVGVLAAADVARALAA